MSQKKVRSTAPIYIAALVFILYGIFFPLYTMRHILIASVIAMLCFCIALPFFPKKLLVIEEKPKPADTGNAELNAIIDRGNEAIAKLRELNGKIRDEYLSFEIARMEKACRSIFDTVAEKPQRVPDIRKFMNYYLPTSIKLLESYLKLSVHNTEGENVRASIDSIKDSMDMIATAFEKQADRLFADENLDITTDIEVLERVMKSEGLKE